MFFDVFFVFLGVLYIFTFSLGEDDPVGTSLEKSSIAGTEKDAPEGNGEKKDDKKKDDDGSK